MIITVEIAQLRDCSVLAKGKIVHAIVACSIYTSTGRISCFHRVLRECRGNIHDSIQVAATRTRSRGRIQKELAVALPNP